MARDYYIETITGIAADGTMKALSNIEVKIKKATTSDLATVYTGRSGGTVYLSEFTISDSTPGLIEFWAEKGEYDIYLHDLNPIPRIADKVLHWTSQPLEDVAVGFEVGDIKISSKSASHGRWLRLAGQELTQAQIEAALGLSAGGGLAIVTELGTGSASKYGSAATDKVKFPDMRRTVPVFAGPVDDGSSSFSVRPMKGTGSTGGVEQVTLTAGQSGLPAHVHSVNDPGHNHNVSGSKPAQTTSMLGWDGSGPKATTGNWYPLLTHNVGSSGEFFSTGLGLGAAPYADSLTIVSKATGISIAAVSSAPAANAHENMPPYTVIGHAFIRV